MNTRNGNIIVAAGVVIAAHIMLTAISFWLFKLVIAVAALILIGYFMFKMLEI